MATLQITVLVLMVIWVLPARLGRVASVKSGILQILLSVSIQVFSRINLNFFFIGDIRQSSWVKLNLIDIKVVMNRPVML